MEIVGINQADKCNLVELSVAQCRDGNYKHSQFISNNYNILNVLSSTFMKFLKEEEDKQRTYSFEGYSSVTYVIEDEFGCYMKFCGHISHDKSELNREVFYQR